MRRIGGTRSPASCCAIRPTPTRARRSRASSARSWRASMPSIIGTLPPLAHREAADQVAGLRARRSTRWASRSRCSSWRSPGSTGASPRRPRGRCWCMAITAPATISPTRRGVTAILDWEGAHLGDPVEDLGWVCVKSWRFGSVDKPAGGFGSREELWAAYETRGRRQGRPGARALVGGVRHRALGHHLPSPRRGSTSRAR